MVILYRDPKGEKIFERTYSASQPTLTHVGDNEVMDRMNELEKHTREMERRLGKYEVSMTWFRYVYCVCVCSNIASANFYHGHIFTALSIQSVTPFRIHSTSFSSSIKIRSGSLNYLTPSSPTHAINPTLSLPVTPLKIPPTSTETKINTANGTSGYLTEGDRSSSASAVERTGMYLCVECIYICSYMYCVYYMYIYLWTHVCAHTHTHTHTHTYLPMSTEKDKTPEQHSDDKPDQQVDIDKMP